MAKLKVGNLYRITFAKLTLIIFVCKTFIYYLTFGECVDLDNILMVLGCLSFLGHVVQSRYTIRKLLIVVFIVLATIWSGYMIGTFCLVPTIMILMLFDRLNFDDFVEVTFSLKVFFISLAWIITFIQWLIQPDKIIRAWDDGQFRVSFCRNNPNVMGFLFTWLIVDWFWLNYNRIKLYNIIAILILDTIMFYFTKTETMIITHLLLILLYFWIKGRDKKYLHRIAKISMPFMIAFTLVGALFRLQKNSFFVWLDKYLFSYRLWNTAYAILNNSPTLFGQTMDWTYGTNSKLVIDNFYTIFIYQYGIFLLALIVVAFWKLSKCENEKISIIIIIFSVNAMMETTGIDICKSIGLAMIAMLFKRNSSRGDNQYDT